jgi:hypothetical protein
MRSGGREKVRVLFRGMVGIAVEVAVSALLMAVSFLLGGTIRHWFLR